MYRRGPGLEKFPRFLKLKQLRARALRIQSFLISEGTISSLAIPWADLKYVTARITAAVKPRTRTRTDSLARVVIEKDLAQRGEMEIIDGADDVYIYMYAKITRDF
jgi:hypothetical protein